jgi:transposase
MQISPGDVLSLLNESHPAADHVAIAGPGLFVVDPADRTAFFQWIRGTTTPRRIVVRSSVVLLAGDGWTNAEIAEHLGISRRTVALWKERYRAGGATSVLADAPGRGRKPGRDMGVVSRILATTSQAPPNGGRWTVRTLARTVGVSHATVQRVWREHGISAVAPRV